MENGWLQSFDELFLGLDGEGRIRRVIGAAQTVLTAAPPQLLGLGWQDFITQYASEPARPGLNFAWLAVSKRYVSAAHWPVYLPFKPGCILRLCAVQDDPEVWFAVHLSASSMCNLDTLVEQVMLEAIERVVRLSQYVFRGVDGPLTDKQVKEMGGVVSHAESLRQVLKDLRAEVFSPAATAPQPYVLKNFLIFSERDFSHRRITTHQLAIHCEWAEEMVYCYPAVHAVVRSILDTLLLGITPRSAIELSAQNQEQTRTVQIEIRYQSQETAFQIDQRIEPLNLADPQRLGPSKPLQVLITMAHSCLKPVGGSAWAEPDPKENGARVILMLPRWQGPIS